MKKIYVIKGEEVIREGTIGDCAYIVDSGTLEVSKACGNSSKVVGSLYEKDIFGELGLIDGLPRSTTVKALEDCTLSVIAKKNFNSLAKSNPKALAPIFKILATRLRSTLKVVEALQAQV